MDHLRGQLRQWSLGSDKKLLTVLSNLSTHFIQNTTQLQLELDQLHYDLNCTTVDAHNTYNELVMLANDQFIENRVYDDEEDDEDEDSTVHCSIAIGSSTSADLDQDDVDLDKSFISAWKTGFKATELFTYKALVQDSDDDDNNGNDDSDEEHSPNQTYCGELVLIVSKRDFYNKTNLPHLIGSTLWATDDNVGLPSITYNVSESDNDDEDDYDYHDEDNYEDEDDSEDEYIDDEEGSDYTPLTKKSGKSKHTLSQNSDGSDDAHMRYDIDSYDDSDDGSSYDDDDGSSYSDEDDDSSSYYDEDGEDYDEVVVKSTHKKVKQDDDAIFGPSTTKSKKFCAYDTDTSTFDDSDDQDDDQDDDPDDQDDDQGDDDLSGEHDDLEPASLFGSFTSKLNHKLQQGPTKPSTTKEVTNHQSSFDDNAPYDRPEDDIPPLHDITTSVVDKVVYTDVSTRTCDFSSSSVGSSSSTEPFLSSTAASTTKDMTPRVITQSESKKAGLFGDSDSDEDNTLPHPISSSAIQVTFQDDCQFGSSSARSGTTQRKIMFENDDDDDDSASLFSSKPPSFTSPTTSTKTPAKKFSSLFDDDSSSDEDQFASLKATPPTTTTTSAPTKKTATLFGDDTESENDVPKVPLQSQPRPDSNEYKDETQPFLPIPVVAPFDGDIEPVSSTSVLPVQTPNAQPKGLFDDSEDSDQDPVILSPKTTTQASLGTTITPVNLSAPNKKSSLFGDDSEDDNIFGISQATSSATQQVSPTAQQVSPTAQQVSPTAQQVSPTAQQVSPTAQQVSPESDNTSLSPTSPFQLSPTPSNNSIAARMAKLGGINPIAMGPQSTGLPPDVLEKAKQKRNNEENELNAKIESGEVPMEMKHFSRPKRAGNAKQRASLLSAEASSGLFPHIADQQQFFYGAEDHPQPPSPLAKPQPEISPLIQSQQNSSPIMAPQSQQESPPIPHTSPIATTQPKSQTLHLFGDESDDIFGFPKSPSASQTTSTGLFDDDLLFAVPLAAKPAPKLVGVPAVIPTTQSTPVDDDIYGIATTIITTPATITLPLAPVSTPKVVDPPKVSASLFGDSDDDDLFGITFNKSSAPVASKGLFDDDDDDLFK